MEGKSCHCCGQRFAAEFVSGFRDVCPQCQGYLHCCLNCRLYDRNAHHQCRSSTTEFVQDKEKANFCEEFDWNAAGPSVLEKDETKKRFDDLFGGAQAPGS